MFLKNNKTITLVLVLVSLSSYAQSTKKLSVEELFELGVANSLEVQSSKVNRDIAGSNLLDKKAGMLPDINVGIAGGYIGEPTVFKKGLTRPEHPGMPDWNQNYSVDVLQPVYQGGGIRRAIDKAALQTRIAELMIEKDISQIKLLLIGKYLDILQLHKQQEAIATSISQARQRLHDIKNMERNGMVTSSDVLRCELQLSNYELTLKQIQNDIIIVSTQLDIALGLNEDCIILPDSSILHKDHALMPYNSYVETAYERYPELKISQSNIEIATQERLITKGGYLPKLSLHASNILLRPITSVSPAQDLYANNWNIGLTLSYNLSSLYHHKNKMDMATQNIRYMDLEKQKIIQNIKTNVKADYIKHNESLERIKTLTISVEQANENYRIVLNKYNNQIAILTDLLDASTLQLNAQLQLTTARTNAIYTYYQLLRSSGIL